MAKNWRQYADNLGVMPQIDQMVQDFTNNYASDNKSGPGGTTTEDFRLGLLLSYAPASELFRRMLEIGDPGSIHIKSVETRELNKILEEIDRRFPNVVQQP